MQIKALKVCVWNEHLCFGPLLCVKTHRRVLEPWTNMGSTFLTSGSLCSHTNLHFHFFTDRDAAVRLLKLTRIEAEVPRLLLDGHWVERSLARRPRRWDRGSHGSGGGGALLCVPWVDELLLEALGRRHGYQGLWHLPVVGGPAVSWQTVVAAAGGLGQELGASLALWGGER